MSATILLRSLTIGHDPVVLAANVDLTIAPGHVIGLVGPNGAGKTTLLRMIAGLGSVSAGTIVLAPPAATVGYLPQEVQGAAETTTTETITDFVGRRTGVAAAEEAMNASADAMAAGEPGADDAYAAALDRWLALGGADIDSRLAAALADVGLSAATSHRVSELSGGQAARLGLASLLLARFDIFCLDEPTNNLDTAGLATLEQFVRAQRNAVVLVSHDRSFLEHVATDIVELDPVERRAQTFSGGYQSYLDERELRKRHEREAYDDYESARGDLLGRARTVRNWTYEGVKSAKQKTDNDKIGAKKRAESSEKQAAKARRLERAADRLDEVAEPRKVWELQYEIAAASRSGNLVASLRGATVDRGDFRLGPVDLDIHWADRVVVTGPNGSGKSTLLALLLGELTPTSGTVSLGSGVEGGVLDQRRTLFETNDSLMTITERELPALLLPDRRTLLAKFGLGSDDVRRPAAELSPGERTRAQMAIFQARGVNLLVLDEPTNHLDLPAIEQLEAALDRYEGTLILVTHDRQMLDNVTVTRSISVDAGKVTVG
jgi:ATPase subunit of ABC transporter with duplicated ATPase domains